MSIIEQIKTEIERLKEHTSKCGYPGQDEYADGNKEGRNFICDKLLSFLSTTESEKPMNLEEEINRYLREECSNDDEPGIHEIAEHFAEWGYLRAAEKYNEIEYNRQRAEESVPNDLEKAAKEYAKTTFKKPYSDNPDEEVTIVEPDKYDGFIAGAKWDREQMMKEAVEGEVDFINKKWGLYDDEEQTDAFLRRMGVKREQKVRIIIVKED